MHLNSTPGNFHSSPFAAILFPWLRTSRAFGPRPHTPGLPRMRQEARRMKGSGREEFRQLVRECSYFSMVISKTPSLLLWMSVRIYQKEILYSWMVLDLWVISGSGGVCVDVGLNGQHNRDRKRKGRDRVKKSVHIDMEWCLYCRCASFVQ